MMARLLSRTTASVLTFVHLCLAGLVLTSPGLESRALAQVDPQAPLLIVNVASFERLLGQVATTFEAAGRPELAESLGGQLARVNDLKGLNRNQSMGVMLYLTGFSPTTVAYVPVKNIDDLMKTAELGPVSTTKVGEDRYEVKARQQTLYVKMQGNYAFVSNDSSAVNLEYPDPAATAKRFSASYDVSAAVSLKSLEPATRQLFYNIFKAQAENGLQRRDNEPEAAWEMRKAEGERTLAVMEILLNQGNEILVGWTMSPVEKAAALEVVITANQGSEYAAYFAEIQGARSRFSNLVNTTNPMSLSLSWKLDKPSRKSMRTMLGVAQKEMFKRMAADDANVEDENHPIRQLFSVLDGTVAEGHADLLMQMVGTAPGPFSLVGGMKMEDTGTLSNALLDVLGRLKGRPGIADVRLNSSTHNGVDIHRIEPAGQGSGRERLFGGPPSIYLAVDKSVLWFAVGAEKAPGDLKKAMDKAAEPRSETAAAVPMQMVMNFASFSEMFDPQQSEGFAGRARRAFGKGGDALRMEVLPVTDGMRFRIQFDEAFLRLAGAEAARRMDRGN
jgi:hypothetical protein